MPEAIASRAERAIREKVFPGCVIGVIQNGERSIFPFGHFTYENDSAPVQEHTIYDLASITKSIPTASLALSSVARLNLADPVKKYIPELQNDFGATIEDLLRYRVHGVQMSTLAQMSADEIQTYVFTHGFDGPPGASEYTNLPAYLLGIVIERDAGEKLGALAQKHFFDPLGMRNSAFLQRPGLCIAPTEIVDGKEICGIPHDESARVFAREGKAVGHAGLFSTAPDLLNFLEALLQGKFPAIVAGAEAGLGWRPNEPWTEKHRGATTFGKTGFTGTWVVVDRTKNIAFVILSNRTYPKRPADNSAINSFRTAIADIFLNISH